MEGTGRSLDLTPEQSEQGKKVRLGKLRAKLQRTRDAGEKEKLQAAIRREEASPSPAKPAAPPAPEAGGQLVKQADLKEVVDSFVGLSALTGYPIVCSELAVRNLTSGLAKMAKRKGWSLDQLGEWVLIGTGIVLIAAQTTISWVNIIKEKNREEKNAPKVQPDAPDSPDRRGQIDAP